jgi:hypothetical protein
MTRADASRIQSAEARENDGKVKKGDFASRAQSAADTRAFQALSGGSGGIASGSIVIAVLKVIVVVAVVFILVKFSKVTALYLWKRWT